MSLKNLSAIAANNTLAPPFGAPESSTKLKDYNDCWRYLASVVRHGASSNTIASAATCDLGSLDEAWLTVSGITTITSFGTVSAGIYKVVTFSGALTLTHNATSLILLGGANRTTVAGDCGLYLSLGGGNWKEYFYSPITAAASYQPLDAQLTTLAGITAQQATDLAAVSAFIGTLLNDADASAAQTTLGISTFVKTLLDDADAATFRTSIGAQSGVLDNAFSVYLNADQTVTSGIDAKILLNTGEFNISGSFASSRFTPTVAGYYHFDFSVGGLTNAAAGIVIARLYKNAALIRDGSRAPTSNDVAVSTGSTTLYLNGSTDYVELWARVSGVTVYGLQNYTHLAGYRVGT